MIKTKSIYDQKEKSGGIRILITRYWPRGIKKDHFDRWIKELSPSIDLLKKYKNKEIDGETFEKLFLTEIKTSKSINVKRSQMKVFREKILHCCAMKKKNQSAIEAL